MDVYKTIAAVMADIGREGIAKNRRNQQQGYSFRGIDDLYNALNPIMARHGLVMLPTIRNVTVTEKTSAKGAILIWTTIEVEFRMVAASDGSECSVTVRGEAMDSGDKSSNKAMSAAWKYAAMMTFAIPTEGDNDADATSHEVVEAVETDDAARLAKRANLLAWLDRMRQGGSSGLKAAFDKLEAHHLDLLTENEIRKLRIEAGIDPLNANST